MTLGPVFVIHGGPTEDRIAAGEVLVESWNKQYPYWTETQDAERGNLVLVFATNSRDVWSVSPLDISKDLETDPTIDIHRMEFPHNPHEQEPRSVRPCSGPTLTFGFCRYP